MIISRIRSTALTILSLALAGVVYASPPATITNLSANGGATPGSIVLSWTVPNGFPVKYIIKYKTSSATITTDAEFDSASRIEEPPIQQYPPVPIASQSFQFFTLTGLQQGAFYSFAIKSENANGERSAVSSNGAFAQATQQCSRDIDDGNATATLIPVSWPSGQVVVATITFTPSVPILSGGKIAIQIPDGFTPPQTSSSNAMGYFSTNFVGSAVLTPTVSGQKITYTVSNSPVPTSSFNFYYVGFTCDVNSTRYFRVATQKQACGVLTEILASPFTMTSTGSPYALAFDPFEIVTLVNSVAAVDISLKDSCGRNVTALSPLSFTLKTKRYDGTSYVTDTSAALSATSDMSSPTQNLNSAIAASASAQRVYYRITTDTQKPNYVEINFNAFQSPFNPISYLASVRPLTNGISEASIDKGTLLATQTSVTFNPGKNEKAYINFKLPDDMQWRIQFSSNGFSNVARTLYGYGKNNRISWDGYADPSQPGQPYSIANPATYAVRILVGNTLQDNSLTAILNTSGAQGFVYDSVSLTPLANVNIEFFGNTSRFTQSLADGSFKIFGLDAGSYRVRFNKTGYIFKEVTQTIADSATANMGNTSLTQAAILRLFANRPTPASGSLPNLNGSVRAFNSDYSKQSYGTVRFRTGQTTSDAGDDYNATPTPYTDLYLEPGIAYTVTIEVPSHAPMSFSENLTVGISSRTKNLVRQPMVEGLITLPAGSNPNGNWVSVEAALDANNDLVPDSNDPSKRAYGGVYLPAGELSGTYRIFGLADGHYVLTANVQGLVRKKIGVTVAGADALNSNITGFSTGGSISGTLTINGDSTVLDDLDGLNDGIIHVPVNAYSPTIGNGSYIQTTIAESLTSTTSSYQIPGLEDGTYYVYIYQPGFGLNPPGQKVVTVSGGVGTLNLTLEKFTGQISGKIILPGAASDYTNVQIDALAFNNQGGVTPSATINGNTYSVQGLGTDTYSIRARYPGTGLVVSFAVPVSNGKTSTRDIDLSGATYSISGHVTSVASTPYTLDYIVLTCTPTPVELPNHSLSTLPANRITATLLRDRNFNEGASPNGALFYDPKQTYVATISTAGAYTLNGLAPGSYQLRTNGELDGNLSDGNEISLSQSVVYVNNRNLTNQDFTLSDGFSVSGTIRVASGVSEAGRNLRVKLLDSEDNTAGYKDLTLTGTSVTFSIDKIRPGNYILTVDDSFPKKYASKDKSIQVVGANVTNQEIQLLNASVIRGKLQIKTSGVVISASNYSQYLTNNFIVEARSNPWIPGGYGRAENPIVDSDGYFNVAVNPGTYDIVIYSFTNLSESDIASGKKQFVQLKKSAITVAENETKDIGFVALSEGIEVTGTVRDTTGNPISNVRVLARSAKNNHSDNDIEAFTDSSGKYVLRGIDSVGERYYTITASPRPDPFDTRFIGDPGTGRYGQLIKGPIDTSRTTNVDFNLEAANGRITATVLTSDGGEMLVPFGEKSDASLPGAYVILNRLPDIPRDNPLGDLKDAVSANGAMDVKGLAPGVYNVYILARGYGSVTKKKVLVSANQTTNLGTLTLPAGFTVSGAITKSNGQPVNKTELDTLVAVRDNFNEISIGKTVTDAAGNILEYSIAGIQANKSYTILGFDRNNAIINLASNLSMSSDSEQDLIFTMPTPGALAQSFKNSDGSFTVTFKFDGTLRKSDIDLNANGTADDDEILTLTSGAGTLSGFEISSSRTEAKVIYTPVAGETSFTLTVHGTFVSQSDTSGANHTINGPFTFFIGIARQNSATLTNANGGQVDLSAADDGSSFTAPAGFLGENEDATADVTIKAADTQTDLLAAAPSISRLGVMTVAEKLGLKAYPSEMAAAISRLKTLDVSPYSSFYDIFLPAGVSHFFPEGKEARLCMTYDSSAKDPYALNLYYYNSATNEYLLENTEKTVDVDNLRICATLSHASVFTVLASSDSIITGAGYTGELAVMNFPNPFNLKQKTLTLQNPGSANASQTINGTMIKLSVPPSLAGTAEMKIYNVAGESVRTIHLNVAGGAHTYIEWDGKNEGGQKVASGTYIARLTINGGNEKFFKMAVLK